MRPQDLRAQADAGTQRALQLERQLLDKTQQLQTVNA